MLRIVLDTNVLVSAAIAKGKPRELLKNGMQGRFHIVTSEFIVREFGRVLSRRRFETSEDEIQRLTLALIQSSEIVSVRSSFRKVKEDPDDDAILNTAYDGNADIIATGDRHLLELKSFKSIRIQSVSDVLKEL